MKVRVGYTVRINHAAAERAETPELPPPLKREPEPEAKAAPKFKRRILNSENHDPEDQLNLTELVPRVVTLAQALCEKKFYPYQIELACRIVEALLQHKSDVITALISRQSGKTESLSAIIIAIALIFPKLATDFPSDWRFNITDDNGVDRGFRTGVLIGIYAPRLDQAEIMFSRVKKWLETDTCKAILSELRITCKESNGDRIRLSNGSRILCQSASEQSKIEGETHHLLVLEEAQDIGDMKAKKSLSPMVSSLLGTTVKIGTASTQKCDFYDTIKTNQRQELIHGTKNNFFFPYTVTQKHNSLYKTYIEAEKIKLGEDSDEFQLSYGCRWIFERGMFVTQDQLVHRDVSKTEGIFSIRHPYGANPRLMPGHKVVVGIDWGSSSDSTVLTTMAVNWNTPKESGDFVDMHLGTQSYMFYEKHILDWVEFIGDNYEFQWGVIMQYLKNIQGLSKIVTDSNTAGRPIFDRLSAYYVGSDVEVVDFNFHSKIKSDGYKSYYQDICGKRLTYPSGREVRKTLQWRKFMNQMLDLRKEYKNGLMVCKHPDEKSAHDDYPDSSMLAAYGCCTPVNSGLLEVGANPFYS